MKKINQNELLEILSAEKIFLFCKDAARNFIINKNDVEREYFAKAFCQKILTSYWAAVLNERKSNWNIFKPSFNYDLNNIQEIETANEIGLLLKKLEFIDAGYLIGTLYTILLPNKKRSTLGAYYTPPALVKRLLNDIENVGFCWGEGKILDPACGGAAFLSSVAQIIVQENNFKNQSLKCKNTFEYISSNLSGFEIDPFAAWISQVLIEIAIIDVCLKINKRLPPIICVGDSLKVPLNKHDNYDLIIGNPPYGRITLSNNLRSFYKDSLYGHANLYGLFTDLAIHLAAPNGIIAYVTPTSFLGGQYFKSLRNLLQHEAPPLIIDFVTDRIGVFENVLQETLLIIYHKGNNRKKHKTTVNSLKPNGSNNPVNVAKIGTFKLPPQADTPWLFPRSKPQKNTLGKALSMPFRLKDYGYEVNTGQLVWNRHKEQLKTYQGNNNVPLVWAESVLNNGEFHFKATRKNHKPYFAIKSGQEFLLTKKECVLIQRTTAKEQNRRLIAALLPQQFINRFHAGVVIENHLNIIKPLTSHPVVPAKVLTALLNSQILDDLFRCISGSVAVSAYELNALPLPDPKNLLGLLFLLKKKSSLIKIEFYIQKLYGV